MRLPVNTVIHTTLVGLEPATFRSLVRRATSSATESTSATELSTQLNLAYVARKYKKEDIKTNKRKYTFNSVQVEIREGSPERIRVTMEERICERDEV